MSNILFDPLFGRHADSDAPFLMLEGANTISYAEFAALSARLANVFAGLGLTKGDRVALQVAKSPTRWRSMPPACAAVWCCCR